MASLYKKVVSGRPYWYLREMAWVEGKPKLASERYLGTAAEIEALLDTREEAVIPERTRHLAFGDVAALWGLLLRLGLLGLLRLQGLLLRLDLFGLQRLRRLGCRLQANCRLRCWFSLLLACGAGAACGRDPVGGIIPITGRNDAL